MSIAELLALADLVKNETGIGRNNAVRIGMALEEIIKYFRDNGGSGGEPGSADGGVLESISAMNFAPQGKFYGVQLAENHPELGINHFSLICMRGGSQEELVQVAIGYDGTAQKLWLRGGEINSYGLFNQISGGGETVDEVDPVFAAWKAASFIGGRLKPSLLPQEIEEMSPIEFEATDVINGIIIPESPTKLYRISTATDLTVTINTTLLDLTKYIKLFVKINLNDYVVLTFPENWYFANLAIPTEVGEYLYEVSSSDGGDTWRASQRYKNIATVGIDQEGNEIVGAKTLFVDGEKADNSGNGLTWLTAKKDVQAAIDITNSGDAVFVKGKLDGLKYLPTTERTPGTARSKSFVMKAGVNVYGGFKGIESTLYEREMISYPQTMNLPTGTFTMYVDIPKYRSILSGEIAGDSIINPSATVGNQFTTASIANNSYTVVIGNSSTINGFEVIGGNCPNQYSSGGITGTSSTKIANCAIYSNYGSGTLSNGGVYSSSISNCLVYNNSGSNSGVGGANVANISNSVIYNNIGGSGGGGAYSSVLNNCAVYGNVNTSSDVGVAGGISYNSTAQNCVIRNNTGQQAGGAGQSNLTNCSVYSNNTNTGGGITNTTAINCLIYNNNASNLGGGVYVTTGNPSVVNCSIFNNSAATGGGVYGNANIINCSVVRNKATVGAGTYNSILQNTVVYGNKTGALVKSNVYNDNARAETYSAFEDEVRAGTGNISLSVNNEGDATSPCFQSLSNDIGVVDEIYVSNLKICNDSYLIDKGLDSYLTTGYGSLYDVESKPRKVDTIDIGAYENQKTV